MSTIIIVITEIGMLKPAGKCMPITFFQKIIQ